MLKLNIFTSHSVNSIRRLKSTNFKSPSSVSEDVSVVYLIIVLLYQIQGTEKAIYSNCLCFYNQPVPPIVWYSVQVRYLLPGQRSGLVLADTPPLALQWTCYVARPAVAHGSNISEKRRRKIGKLVTTGKIYTYSHRFIVTSKQIRGNMLGTGLKFLVIKTFWSLSNQYHLVLVMYKTWCDVAISHT